MHKIYYMQICSIKNESKEPTNVFVISINSIKYLFPESVLISREQNCTMIGQIRSPNSISRKHKTWRRKVS